MAEQERIQRSARVDLEPTDGQWRYLERSLTPSGGGTFVVQLAAYYQGPDVWTWFDDIQIRRIWQARGRRRAARARQVSRRWQTLTRAQTGGKRSCRARWRWHHCWGRPYWP